MGIRYLRRHRADQPRPLRLVPQQPPSKHHTHTLSLSKKKTKKKEQEKKEKDAMYPRCRRRKADAVLSGQEAPCPLPLQHPHPTSPVLRVAASVSSLPPFPAYSPATIWPGRLWRSDPGPLRAAGQEDRPHPSLPGDVGQTIAMSEVVSDRRCDVREKKDNDVRLRNNEERNVGQTRRWPEEEERQRHVRLEEDQNLAIEEREPGVVVDFVECVDDHRDVPPGVGLVLQSEHQVRTPLVDQFDPIRQILALWLGMIDQRWLSHSVQS
eukprot:2354981-Rhodomonas_salina.1